MLTGRNEWIAIGALILWIAFVPCPYQMKQFFASPIGKVIALGAVVYTWKYVSCPVAILLLVAFLRSGAVREYLEGETGMTPSTPPLGVTEYSCPSEFTYNAEKKMCTKGNETKEPTCKDPSMTWDMSVAMCVSKPTTASSGGAGGPSGGTSAGSMQALNDIANEKQNFVTMAKEGFQPFGGQAAGNFAPA